MLELKDLDEIGVYWFIISILRFKWTWI